MHVEWRDGGGRTRLGGVTELGRMTVTDPNLPLSVAERLGRLEAGRSAGGIDPQRKGWVRLQDRAGESSSSNSRSSNNSRNSNSSGGRTPPPPSAPNPPPRPPRKNPASRVARKTPPPSQALQSKPDAKPKPKGKGKGKANPPPQAQAPLLQDRCRDPYGNVPRVGDTRCVPLEDGGNGGTVSQVT